MSLVIHDKVLLADITNLWNANNAGDAQVAAKTLAERAQADIETLPPNSGAELESLKQILAYANSYEYDPNAPHVIPLDEEQLQNALAYASEQAGPDLAGLFEAYIDFLNKLREGGAKISAASMAKGLNIALTVHQNDLDAAQEEKTASDINAGSQVASGVTQMLGTAEEGRDLWKANKQLGKAQGLSEEINDDGKISGTKGLQTRKLESDESLDEANMHLDTVRDSSQSAVPTERQTALREMPKARQKVNAIAKENREVTQDLKKVNDRIQAHRESAQNWRTAGSITSGFTRALGEGIQGMGGLIASPQTLASEEDKAESKLLGSEGDLVKQTGESGANFAADCKSGIDSSLESMKAYFQSKNELNRTMNQNSI